MNFLPLLCCKNILRISINFLFIQEAIRIQKHCFIRDGPRARRGLSSRIHLLWISRDDLIPDGNSIQKSLGNMFHYDFRKRRSNEWMCLKIYRQMTGAKRISIDILCRDIWPFRYQRQDSWPITNVYLGWHLQNGGWLHWLLLSCSLFCKDAM